MGAGFEAYAVTENVVEDLPDGFIRRECVGFFNGFGRGCEFDLVHRVSGGDDR